MVWLGRLAKGVESRRKVEISNDDCKKSLSTQQKLSTCFESGGGGGGGGGGRGGG